MLTYYNTFKETNSKIILNYSISDINSTEETEKLYPVLYKLTKLAISHITYKYKQFKYLINKTIELSLVITNNSNIALINLEWKGLMQATNVLSMSLMSPEDARINPIVLLGDVIISLEKAKEEADLLKINYQDYLISLLIHGIVHIFGFDHQTEKEALIMKNIEEDILKLFSTTIKPLTNNYWEK